MVIKDPLELRPRETPREILDDARPIWEIIAEIAASIPPEERDKIPHDGSIRYREYLYGKKRNA